MRLLIEHGKTRGGLAMRLLIIFAAVILFFTMSVCFAADSFTCGTNLVSVGDQKIDVLTKCGPPYKKMNSDIEASQEQWIYNFGSSEFMKILSFDGERLESIEDGDKGIDE